ncbi:MAG TPA: hypothetical protein VM580_35475, partial [Labilithrix sp.]|nr:hypothetical protein [Labilithrix sp.]
SSVTGATTDASAPPQTKSGAATTATEVDLLHWTPAEVCVSSNVKNPRDYPQHLVDNKRETAWNSKTDDLVGAYISFAVPAETHVTRIDLSAGFDHSGPKGDYFTMNHRITKVRVFALGNVEKEWDGKEGAIGDFTLDPNERRPQQIPIDKPGGVFVIRVVEVVPGTKKEWRELTVSELHVMGDPGRRRLSHARMPDVSIGRYAAPVTEPPKPSADDPDPTAELPIVASSVADACARWDEIVAPIFAKKFSADVYPGAPEPPYCTPGALVALPAGRVKSVRTVQLTTVEDIEHHVLIETDQGVVIPRDARVNFQSRTYSRTTSTAKVVRASVEDGEVVALVEAIDRFEFYCVGSSPDDPTRFYEATSEFDLRCGLEAKPMTCTRQARKYSCFGPDCPR